jgi:hypothetical protein
MHIITCDYSGSFSLMELNSIFSLDVNELLSYRYTHSPKNKFIVTSVVRGFIMEPWAGYNEKTNLTRYLDIMGINDFYSAYNFFNKSQSKGVTMYTMLMTLHLSRQKRQIVINNKPFHKFCFNEFRHDKIIMLDK